MPSARHRRLANPSSIEPKVEAIGLGLSVLAVGVALADIHERPAYAYAGIIAGGVVTAVYWKKRANP